MPFSDQERAALLALKGVGPTVIKRFEDIGCIFTKPLKRTNALK